MSNSYHPLKPYYEEPGITIYHGDCRDILPHLPKVDLVLTDPPYGIGFNEYESHKDAVCGYDDFIWPICEEAERHIDNGWMCVFQAAKKCRDWHKTFPREYRLIACPKTFVQIFKVSGPTWATDYALLWSVGKPCQKGKGRDWKISDTANMRFDRRHPCARPLTQMNYLVENLSETGAIILDPFMGSGTAGIACRQLGRNFIGIEIEEKYVKIAIDRLRQEVLPLNQPGPETYEQEGLL
jgi:DNA modification methylase